MLGIEHLPAVSLVNLSASLIAYISDTVVRFERV